MDYPLLGRYSSDEREVCASTSVGQAGGHRRVHRELEEHAGPQPASRRLAEVAGAERFKLLVIYQGLDFEREPLPPARIAHDFDFFTRRYSKSKAFNASRSRS